MILIEKELEDFINLKIDFDLGVDIDMSINDKSHNRIKFSIIKMKPKKKDED